MTTSRVSSKKVHNPKIVPAKDEYPVNKKLLGNFKVYITRRSSQPTRAPTSALQLNYGSSEAKASVGLDVEAVLRAADGEERAVLGVGVFMRSVDRGDKALAAVHALAVDRQHDVAHAQFLPRISFCVELDDLHVPVGVV
eukprot:6177055-Pleurochrysis_carterae.AAC.3